MKNYWQILGLEEGASQDEIKKAYKKYAKKFHLICMVMMNFLKKDFKKYKRLMRHYHYSRK